MKANENGRNVVCLLSLRLHTFHSPSSWAFEIVMFENLADNKWLSEETKKKYLNFLFNVTFHAYVQMILARFLYSIGSRMKIARINAKGSSFMQFLYGNGTEQTVITRSLWHLKALPGRTVMILMEPKSDRERFQLLLSLILGRIKLKRSI